VFDSCPNYQVWLFNIFYNFWNRIISEISEISECSENPVSELFQTFPKLFDPKTGFFDSKTQTLQSFFESFEIDVQFWLISELKFPNSFPNFFVKI
jgi:hypothetical protein